MDEPSRLPWRYEVWLRHAPGSRRLVKAGNTAKRYEAMQLVAEMLRHVEPVGLDADATVAGWLRRTPPADAVRVRRDAARLDGRLTHG